MSAKHNWKVKRLDMGQHGWAIMDGTDELVRDHLEAEASARIIVLHNIAIAQLESGIALLEGRLADEAARKPDEASGMPTSEMLESIAERTQRLLGGIGLTPQQAEAVTRAHRLAEISNLCDHGYILCAPCGFLPPNLGSLWG